MSVDDDIEMKDFLPYLLNQAGEEISMEFQRVYKERYGMLRTDWRVLFHLGRYGDLISSEIVRRSKLHKTKVSRAVSRLETKRFLVRREVPQDRRQEVLSLTPAGRAAYRDLSVVAQEYNQRLWQGIDPEDRARITRFLADLAKLEG
ncbi:MarR family winged helix-turn-helix transcriptional regulator [Sulfitobacter aestuarii]|uniref:MarR family winged helix-turn-helix transcriptional regulator n=1 Tax=Sulfitobacter aestuarii TaxID=2161676 RepID=A0ABW5U2S5_9RHOB